MLPQFWVDPPPVKPSIKVGSEVRRRGETLSWEVTFLSDHAVAVQGPSGRKGGMVLSREEFDANWERV